MQFRYGTLRVNVTWKGEGSPDWDPDNAHHQYGVTVTGGRRRAGAYVGDAWGSRKDFEEGIAPEDPDTMRSLARMTVEDLYSAAMDPDDFIDTVIGEAKGREALKLGKKAEAIVASAKEFGDADLEAAFEAARAEEEAETSKNP